MASKRSKPARVVVGSVRARAVRGPHKSGDGRWYWRAERSQDGQRETVFTGWRTPAEVEQELAALVASGDLDTPAEQRSASPRAGALVTVRDLLETWLWHVQNERPDLSRSTVKGYRTASGRILRHLDAHRLDRLDRRTLERFKAARLREGASGTVALDFTVLRIAWGWAWERGCVTERDLSKIQIRVKLGTKYTPSVGEVRAILGALDAPAWRQAVLILQAATGARVGEIATLRWGDVSERQGRLWLRLDGKTGERCVPLFGPFTAAARAVLSDRGEPSASILGVTGDTARGGYRPYLERATERAEVPYFTPHGIRRMAGNLLRRSGIHGLRYEALMGHTEAVARASYHDVQPWELAEAVEQVNAQPAGDVLPMMRTA